MSIELKPREWLLALWANGTFTVEAEDAPCWQAIAPPAMIRAVAALPMEETIKELRAALAAAEAKLADERKHADWLAKQYRECSVWPSTEEQHAGCECGWMWGYMEHGDFEQEEQHAPECPNAVHAARRAAEKEETR